jgi:hypothetical protein
VIQQKVENPLSDRLLSGEFQHGDIVKVILNADGEIALERDRTAETEKEEAPAV